MAQLCEASNLLKRLSERLYQEHNCGIEQQQQPDINSLQEIIDSPLFGTLFNLQQSLQQLKSEFEHGNRAIQNCLFDFDQQGRLHLESKSICSDRLSNENIVRKILLNKLTPYDSLGFSIVVYEHNLLGFHALFVQDIQSGGLADVNGQLRVADQIVCINEIYLDSFDSTLATRAHSLLVDSTRLSIELIVVATSDYHPHAALPSLSIRNGHSCVAKSSTPLHVVDMVLNTLWTQIEVIELTNDGSGLGFGIIGNKSTGVVVKAIVPGSVVDKDGRIHTGDHLFQINHINVRGMSSDQVAGILRQCSQHVRLVVARSVREPTTTMTIVDNTNIGHTLPSTSKCMSTISDSVSMTATTNIGGVSTPETASLVAESSDGIISSSQNKILIRTERLLESNHNFEKILENLRDQCQHDDGTELLDVTLEKGNDGLGITVAGYVSPDSTHNDAIAGIFIRDITDGSVCARDGRLAIGDQIVEVNEQSLHGFSNVQALYLLQNTSSSVRLKVRRYLDGVKHEKIKEMIALESSHKLPEKIEFQSRFDINEQIRQKWTKILGDSHEILLADVFKPDQGGLGITLEGTVDVENGEEVRPHHYIRALLRDGPIGTEGTLRSGDELLEVNNQILYGKNHIHVIEILKRVKHQVKLVCARRKQTISMNEINTDMVDSIVRTKRRPRSASFARTAELIVKAKSMGTLEPAAIFMNLFPLSTSTTRLKSRSLEVISNLALWSTAVIHVELEKEDFGLGFSVLDYQDPSNPSRSPVIVIRALVPGGVAQLDGRIVPGDRLLAVNGIALENMDLDEAIKILKSTPKGIVKLSLSKPLPYPKSKTDSDDRTTTESDQSNGTDQPSMIPRRSSRISKSKTTTGITESHQRSISSHRDHHYQQQTTIKKSTATIGITLSAPAILSRQDFESITMKEYDKKKFEPRASSASRSNRHDRSALFAPLPEKNREGQPREPRVLNEEQFLDLLPATQLPPVSQLNVNLPEFIRFQSDHLVLAPQIQSMPFYDRLRGSSAFSTTKFNRQSANSNQTGSPMMTAMSAGSPHTKRLSRSRHSHEINANIVTPTIVDEQPTTTTHLIRPASLRQQPKNKFDSLSCFHEPDLSSDGDNNNNNNNYKIGHFSSSSSSHHYSMNHVVQSAITTTTRSGTIIDDDAREVDAIIKQHQHILAANPSVTTPTLKTPTTPTLTTKWTSSRQSSRMASPALSTSSQSSGRIITFLNHEVIQFPANLEREIRVRHNFELIGLVVDAYVDEGVNGCYVRSVTPSSTIGVQHCLKPGDYIQSINNENMKKISNAQARSILRRASLIGSDINVIFIPGDEAKQFKDHTIGREEPQAATTSPMPPDLADSDIDYTSKPLPTTLDDGDSYGFDSRLQSSYPTVMDSETLSATLWGPPRTVILHRNERVRSLGISIVGGKLDFSGPGNAIESCISGIFIKHVLQDSPAGRNGTLKTGDRILEVNGHDLRDASHDRAVEIIRAAQSPVHFIVQSLLDPSNPSTDIPPLSSNIPLVVQSSSLPARSTSTPSPSKIISLTDEELRRQYGHLSGDLLLIDVRRTWMEINEPLGLSLIGHRDPNKLAVFVCDIQPGSLLDRDNRIRPGDQLLEVNGEILLGKAHSAVTPIIKSIKADVLNFVILRNPNAIDDMALNSQHAARVRASALTSVVHLSPTASTATTSQEKQLVTHDSSPVHVLRFQPDVDEHKRKKEDGLLSTTCDNYERHNENGEKSSSSPPPPPPSSSSTPLSPTTTTTNKKLSVVEAMPLSPPPSLSSSNRMTPTNDVHDVSSPTRHISSNATITTSPSHLTAPPVDVIAGSSPSTSFNQQLHSYGNDESSSSSPIHIEQQQQQHHHQQHANGNKHLEKKIRMITTTESTNDSHQRQQSLSDANEEKNTPTGNEPRLTKEKGATPTDLLSTTRLPVIESDELVINNQPITATTIRQKPEGETTSTTTNGTSEYVPQMSSSSSSSSLSVPTPPSSAEHLAYKPIRRSSVSVPGMPITLVLNKNDKDSFGLKVNKRDDNIWIQSVQPHGPADEQDIRAGDQLVQINGTPVEALNKFEDIQQMLYHANSNQIHLTCIPYRGPPAEPIVVNVDTTSEILPATLIDSVDVTVEAVNINDPRTRPIVVGQETLIEIDRGRSGLGLSVVGGSDTQLSAIVIHDIYDGCAAQRDGRLLVGDQILEVNSIDLRLATHEEAIQALRQATSVVRILVLRGKMLTEMMNEQDKFDVITVELTKKSGKGLGFSIIGRRHGYGVFISHILEGGCAEKDGRLMSGDLILEVNGQDLRTSAYEHVAYTLKTLPHGRVSIKIGRLRPSSRVQSRQNSVPSDRKGRSRSSSSHLRRSSATTTSTTTTKESSKLSDGGSSNNTTPASSIRR